MRAARTGAESYGTLVNIDERMLERDEVAPEVARVKLWDRRQAGFGIVSGRRHRTFFMRAYESMAKNSARAASSWRSSSAAPGRSAAISRAIGTFATFCSPPSKIHYVKEVEVEGLRRGGREPCPRL